MDVNNGVTQGQIDRNVLSVAELWLSPHQRETVYQSRFTNRIPYNVEMSLDARSLKDFLNVKILRDEKCQDFDWYLKEIYPGLEMDRKNVENTYRNYLSSDYLQIGLEPLLSQYKKERTEQIEPISSAQLLLLQNRENRPEETELKLRKMSAVPKVIRPKVDTPEEIHLKLVRDELQCVDMPKANINDALGPCEILLEKDPDTCKNDYGVMMFACPLSCDLCGEDGKICFDFYDKKCPEWKAEGMCESNSVEMEKKCRLTCGFCTKKQKKDIIVKKEIVGDVRDINKENLNIEELKVEDPHGLDHNSLPKVDKKVVSNPDLFLSDEAKAKIALVTTTKIANPYTAQDQYKKGLLPDPVGSLAGACYLNDKPHGKLLAHMDLMKIETVSTDLTPKKIPRIFCGIYTMESSHKENVQATRETWAKKCDGFVAFSTVDDDSIPAINILHEGVESYNNMWQKSRSIWKYIHAHYSDSFDFFLMGGDDMFYIIENLKHYLMTEEITSYVSSHEGTFLGRRFYPGEIIIKYIFMFFPLVLSYVCVSVLCSTVLKRSLLLSQFNYNSRIGSFTYSNHQFHIFLEKKALTICM